MRRREPVRSLGRLLRPYRWRLTGAGAAFIVKDSPTWVLPPVTAAVIDVVVAGGPLWRIALWGGVALALLALNYPFAMIVVRVTSTAIRSVAYVIRAGLAARLQRFSLGAHNRQSAAVVQTKIVRDVENVELMLAQLMPTGLSALATIVGAVVVTAVRVPSFVLVFALTIPAAAALVFAVRRRAARRNEHFRREVEGLAAQVNEMAALLPITRGHGLEEIAASRVADRADSVRRAGRALDLLNGRFGALSWLTYQILGLTCLIVAASLAVTGTLPISAGDVVLLSTYFTLLTNAVVMLLNVMPVLAKGMDAVRSIGDVAEELDIEDTRGRLDPGPLAGDIELHRVRVQFPGAQTPALDEISLRIAAGETVAFVGPSGSGKSTIVNTVLGFVPPTSGAVTIDGHDLRTLDLTAVRGSVSIVPQETVLLNGTVRENVAYGRADIDDDVILSALRDANALDIVAGSVDGLDAPVGERGSRLSGGQRQRLSIARALARQPRLLIMDEATSALDAASEAQIGEAVERARAGRTTLIVAHRLSTVRRADRIVVVRGGRIVEQGTHDELVAASGAYAELLAAAM